jgi:hypothetical protein
MLDMYAVEGWKDGPVQELDADAENLRTILLACHMPSVQNVVRRVWMVHPYQLADLYRGEVLGSHRREA